MPAMYNGEPEGYDQLSPYRQQAKPRRTVNEGGQAPATTAAQSALNPTPQATPRQPQQPQQPSAPGSEMSRGAPMVTPAPAAQPQPWTYSSNFNTGDVTNYLYRQLVSPVAADGSIPAPGAGGPPATLTPSVSYGGGNATAAGGGVTLPANAPAPYAGDTISQFTAPDQSVSTGLETALLNRVLASPETMNTAAVAALKESQKESALAMQEQQLAGMRQAAAGRGAMGGTLQANVRRSNDATLGTLTGAYRAIDLQKIAQDRADQLAAMNAAEQVLTGQAGRASSLYNTGLGGQVAQANVNQAAARSALDAYNADVARAEADANRGYQYAALNEQARQANLANDLNWANALNNMSMGRFNLGLNYAQLDQTGQSQLMDWLANYFNPPLR